MPPIIYLSDLDPIAENAILAHLAKIVESPDIPAIDPSCPKCDGPLIDASCQDCGFRV